MHYSTVQSMKNVALLMEALELTDALRSDWKSIFKINVYYFLRH